MAIGRLGCGKTHAMPQNTSTRVAEFVLHHGIWYRFFIPTRVSLGSKFSLRSRVCLCPEPCGHPGRAQQYSGCPEHETTVCLQQHSIHVYYVTHLCMYKQYTFSQSLGKSSRKRRCRRPYERRNSLVTPDNPWVPKFFLHR